MPKIDCSLTVNFLTEHKRMCEFYSKCSDCPFSIHLNEKNLLCTSFQYENPKLAVEIVQKWSDKHQPETYMDNFLKLFPNAPISESYKCPCACRGLIYGGDSDAEDLCETYRGSCIDCWHEIFKNNKEDKS